MAKDSVKILCRTAYAACVLSHEQVALATQFCNALLSSEAHQCLSHFSKRRTPGAPCVPQCACTLIKLQDAGWLPAVPSKACQALRQPGCAGCGL